jgi:UV radiation resistance-associated gene protein
VTPSSTVRKSKAFLDLTPLSGFWKSRSQPSSSSSIKAEPPPEEDRAGAATPTLSSATISFVQVQGENAAGSGDDEDDRRTIRGRAGTSSEENDVPEHKVRSKVGLVTTGNINGTGPLGAGTSKEKVASQLRIEPRVVNSVS